MQRVLIIGVAILTVLSLAFNVYHYASTPRLAYVRSQELIENYAGTVEARQSFQKKKLSMMANVDSLRVNFERARIAYIDKSGSLSRAQRVAKEEELANQQNQFYQYKAAIDARISEEDKEMMTGVLNQINSFVEEYAKKNGVDVLLGTTMSGSLLYGNQSMDITEPLLKTLNDKYKGK
jgi:outer membrane protein